MTAPGEASQVQPRSTSAETSAQPTTCAATRARASSEYSGAVNGAAKDDAFLLSVGITAGVR